MARRSVIYSALAERDIASIQQYTILKWGLQQANAYIRSLRRSIRSLATHAELGRVTDAGDPSIRQSIAERHMVYYRVREADVEIIRILHERMDAEAQDK